MSLDATADFQKAVLASNELADWARTNILNPHGVEANVLEQSYLDFLDDMIARKHRGPEWVEVLVRRRTALTPYCGRLLISGLIGLGQNQLFVKVDPTNHKVLYWEDWPADDSSVGGDLKK
jgi:hypothetical protein